jgi:hypothetical protein
MGIVETGLPAGATLILATYYRKKELSLRFALFLACGEAGACFSGVCAQERTPLHSYTDRSQLLAYAIMDNVNGVGGYAGWRWYRNIARLKKIKHTNL